MRLNKNEYYIKFLMGMDLLFAKKEGPFPLTPTSKKTELGVIISVGHIQYCFLRQFKFYFLEKDMGKTFFRKKKFFP